MPRTICWLCFGDGGTSDWTETVAPLTAALLWPYPRVELDAILSHEISHFHRLPHSPWMVLGAALIVTHTATADLLSTVISPLVILLGLPLVFLWALHDKRIREFAEDAG